MKKYTILKNWHYAFLFFGRFLGWHYNKKNYSLNFKFSKECWWKIPRNIDDYDINKLCGLSFGHKKVLYASGAWRPPENILSDLLYSVCLLQNNTS